MPKKAKAKKTKAKPAAKPVTAAEPVSKVQRVRALCERAEGATLEQIVDELRVSKQAASSLIGDLRRKKIAVAFKDGVYKI